MVPKYSSDVSQSFRVQVLSSCASFPLSLGRPSALSEQVHEEVRHIGSGALGTLLVFTGFIGLVGILLLRTMPLGPEDLRDFRRENRFWVGCCASTCNCHVWDVETEFSNT